MLIILVKAAIQTNAQGQEGWEDNHRSVICFCRYENDCFRCGSEVRVRLEECLEAFNRWGASWKPLSVTRSTGFTLTLFHEDFSHCCNSAQLWVHPMGSMTEVRFNGCPFDFDMSDCFFMAVCGWETVGSPGDVHWHTKLGALPSNSIKNPGTVSTQNQWRLSIKCPYPLILCILSFLFVFLHVEPASFSVLSVLSVLVFTV